MLNAIRQYLVVAALGLWQGGFSFYALVVVPIGTDILGGSTEQGFVTREVTRWLNWIALPALLILLWNVIASRGRLLGVTWGGMLLAQAALFVLHPRLDGLLDPATHDVADGFHLLHETYLWIAAAQWALGLVHLWCVLAAWRLAGRQVS